MTLRHVIRIARWEVTSGTSGLDRRALVIAAITVVALMALMPVVVADGSPPEAGIYRIGVDESSPYFEAIRHDPTMAVHPPDPSGLQTGDLEVLVSDRTVRVRDTQKGRAAGAALKTAVEQYNDRLMRTEPDQTAAFPVTVDLEYVERDVLLVRAGGPLSDGTGSTGSGIDRTPEGPTPGETDKRTGTAMRSSEGADGGLGGLPSFGGSEALLGSSAGTPSEISPPFPFVSLVLAFAFIVPMNFVIQAYASSVLHERGRRRAELVLVSPVSRWTIITGKALPYFSVMVLIAAATSIAIGGGLLSLMAVIPVSLLFLSCAFVGALLARSHKELTFVLVTVSVVVTTYVFVPAIFTDIHPIAAISPLTLVVRELEGATTTTGTVLFSTVPVLVVALILFGLGGGLYREEDLFAQRPIPAKLLDALANPIDRQSMAGVMSIMAIPFVFLAELLAIAVLFVLPLELSLPLLLASIATIEEVAKSLHLYAGYERGRYDRSIRTAGTIGVLSGLGFFIGEKAAAVSQVVGLMQLDLGRAAFELGAGLGGAPSPLSVGLLFLAPLGLHTVTTTIASAGASRGSPTYLGGLAVAIVVHTAYNIGVVRAIG